MKKAHDAPGVPPARNEVAQDQARAEDAHKKCARQRTKKGITRETEAIARLGLVDHGTCSPGTKGKITSSLLATRLA